MESFLKTHTHTPKHSSARARAHTDTNFVFADFRTWNMNMKGLLSTTTEKQECCQRLMGPNEGKLSNIRFLSSLPQNKHPMITLAMDHRAVSLLSCVSCLV